MTDVNFPGKIHRTFYISERELTSAAGKGVGFTVRRDALSLET